MLTRILQYFSVPVLPGDDDKTRVAASLNTLILVILATILALTAAILTLNPSPSPAIWIVLPFVLLLGVLLWMIRHGWVRAAGLVLVAGTWAVLTFAACVTGGVSAPAFSGYVIVILCAGLILDRRATMGVAGASLLAGLAMAYAESNGWLAAPPVPSPLATWAPYAAFFVVAAVLLDLHTRRISAALAHARQEIEERKQTEQALRASEVKWRTLVENAPQLILTIDRLGHILFINHINPGWQPEQIAGSTIYNFLSPEVASMVNSTLEHVFEEAVGLAFEAPALGAGSVTLWYACTLGPIVQDGQVVAAILNATDITDRKQAEKTLRDSQTRYRMLFEDSPVILLEEDFSAVKQYVDRLRDSVQDWARYFENHLDVVRQCAAMVRIVDVNQAALAWYQADDKASLLVSLSHILSQAGYPAFREELLALAEGKTSYEIRGVRTNTLGDSPHLIVRGTVAPGYEDSWARVLVSILDITEHEQAKEALRASNETLGALIQVSPLAIILLGLDGNVKLWNPAAECMFGWTAQEILGHPNPIVPENRQAEFEHWRVLALQGQVVVTQETVCQRQDGTLVEVSLSTAGLRDADGNICDVMAIMADITERKQAEQALRESEERMRRLANAAFEGIVITEQGRVVEANEQVAHMLRCPLDELIGAAVMDFVAPESRELVMSHIRAGDDGPYDHLALRKDGTTFPAEVQARRLPYPGRQARVTAIRDITQRKRAEQLQAALYRISEAAQMAQDLDALYRLIHRIIGELMPAKNFYIALYDPATDLISMAYHVDEFDTPSPPSQLGKGLTAYVVRTGQPLLVNSQSYAQLVESGQVEKLGAPPVDWLGVPLKTLHETIGVMTVQTYSESERLSEADKDVLLFVSTQVAMAIERKRVEAHIHRLNRMLRVINEANQALVRADQETDLLERICRIIVEVGGYRMAWVGLAEHDAAKSVRPVAAAGHGTDYLDDVAVTWGDTERGRGPTGTAIRTGQFVVARDILTDPRFAQWRERTLERGYSSSIALPLLSDGQAFGALNIYAGEPDAFGADEVKLLTEMADDLAYGILALRTRAAHRQAEADLRESERRLRAIVDEAPFGAHLYQLEADGRLVFTGANRAADEILRVDNTQFVGKTIEEAFPALTQTEIPAAYRRVAATGERYEHDQVDYDESGIRGAFEIHAFQTGPNRMAVFFREITERRRAEMALRQSEELYRRAIESAGAVPYYQDYVSNSYRFVGDGILELTGYSAAEMTPDLFSSLTQEVYLVDRPDLPIEEAIQLSRSGKMGRWRSEGRILTRDGQTRWVSDSAVEVLDQNSVARGSIGILQDITERKQAEEEIKRLNQDLERRARGLAALNRAGQLMSSILDQNTLLTKVMEQAQQLLDAESASVLLCVPPAEGDLTQLPAGQELMFAAAPGTSSDKLVGMRLPGTVGIAGWVMQHREALMVDDTRQDTRFDNRVDAVSGMTTRSLMAVPLVSRGEVLGVIEAVNKLNGSFDSHDLDMLKTLASSAAIAIDNARLFTEELDRAAALKRALEQQRELDRLQREFIQNVSHELRTPLALIRGHAEVLESGWMGELNAEQKESIGVIARRSLILTKLVNDIITVLEIEQRELVREPFDMVMLVRSVLTGFRPAAEQADLVLSAEIPPHLPLAFGDTLALRRALDNLLNNALKFTPAGGRITVRLYQTESAVKIEVADTGIGIPSDQLDRVFERFYQVDGSSTRKYGGIGLGLSLVKSIVEGHRGQVTLASTVRVGTTFTITLPLDEI